MPLSAKSRHENLVPTFREQRFRGSTLSHRHDYAEVTGIVGGGWPSATGCLVATRIEHVRSFLLHAIDMMAAKGEITVS